MVPPQPSQAEMNQQQQYVQAPSFGSVAGGSMQQQDSQEQIPQQLTSAEMRKLNAATGRGLRVEAPAPTVSGELIYLQNSNGEAMPCRRCNVTPCQGLRWIFEDEIRFKCNTCGKHMKLGYTERGAYENQQNIQGWERADQNRRRAWREQDAERSEQMHRDFDELSQSQNPYLSATRDRGFVMSEFF